ncbi:hypothetical protein LMG27177_07121 [Paraburkholderia fynbosensis]|uniref:Uncharacterized protein n=1 Tax=Paraburkholderia fynbosensis TaxID=1200993 RepID=A0A6J5H443_9BURK|nr:hypothetical protein LMG27177_07121 [Paraburkholderia fynbosensis]
MIINLPVARRNGGRGHHCSGSIRRILGEVGEFVPRSESGREVFAIERSTQQMPLEREMLPYRTETREECLRAVAVAKSAHATLAFAGRLVAVLRSIVHARRGFNEHVSDVRQFGNIGLCGRVAAQLVGHDLARHRA